MIARSSVVSASTLTVVGSGRSSFGILRGVFLKPMWIALRPLQHDHRHSRSSLACSSPTPHRDRSTLSWRGKQVNLSDGSAPAARTISATASASSGTPASIT
jgi:hypothetical protein